MFLVILREKIVHTLLHNKYASTAMEQWPVPASVKWFIVGILTETLAAVYTVQKVKHSVEHASRWQIGSDRFNDFWVLQAY